MYRLIIFFILTTTFVSCDTISEAFLENNSGRQISVSLYFSNYNPSDPDSRQNRYIKNLMADTVIKDNVKLTILVNKIARIDFLLKSNSSIELIYDTAPIHSWTIVFDNLKITSGRKVIELNGKDKIFENFKTGATKAKRTL